MAANSARAASRDRGALVAPPLDFAQLGLCDRGVADGGMLTEERASCPQLEEVEEPGEHLRSEPVVTPQVFEK
jgi:hypothetical protein